MSANHAIIAKAIEQALAHAKKHGIKEGTICATNTDEYAFAFLRADGVNAIIDTVDGVQKRPLEQVFDVNLAQDLAFKLQDEELILKLCPHIT